MQPIHVAAGTAVFRAGEPSRAVYLIEDGEVAITVGRIEVARLRAGELFGESGVLEARARAATATALTATTLLVTDSETFVHAFGMDNDRALSLVKLLCRRLRGTTLRAAQAPPEDTGSGDIRLVPDHDRLITEYGLATVEVRYLPFQVGNRYGGETLPIASNHSVCIPAHGETDLAAPHFEILRRGARLGVRDLGGRHGTMVNGVAINRQSPNAFVPLRPGDNAVIAGRPGGPFHFRVQVTAR